jgi:predicted Zn-dependent protease with MMP-like domain
MTVTREQFEGFVREALEKIPEPVKRRISNVAVVVEDEMRSARRSELPITRQGELLGLYQGVPLGRRGGGYNLVLPDKITIFQIAIERIAGPDPEKIKRQAQLTVWHEIAHHLGMSEPEVRAWERRRRGN